jgi:hypothetical protein
MRNINNSVEFRENITNRLNNIIQDDTLCVNIEKGVFNYAIKEASSKKIIKKWENPLFVQIYIDRLRTIYLNLKNPTLLTQLKNKEILPQLFAYMTHQEMDSSHWKELLEQKMKRDANKV